MEMELHNDLPMVEHHEEESKEEQKLDNIEEKIEHVELSNNISKVGENVLDVMTATNLTEIKMEIEAVRGELGELINYFDDFVGSYVELHDQLMPEEGEKKKEEKSNEERRPNVEMVGEDVGKKLEDDANADAEKFQKEANEVEQDIARKKRRIGR